MNNNITKSDALASIREIAKRKGRDWPSRNEFVSESEISMKEAFKHFDRWNDAVKQAGLKPLDQKGSPDRPRGIKREQLIEKIRMELRRRLHQWRKNTKDPVPIES